VEKKELDLWIEKLKAEPDGKKRQAIVGGLCKAHGLKFGEAWKLLKEAGYGVKPEAGTEGEIPPPTTGEKIRVTLRHKTEYPRYRRAGFVLAQVPASYEVTESQLARLKKDPWVVIEKDGGGA
jgi:hypothetical protein